MNSQTSSDTCPVCTLYLREGVSLETHLATHPKAQVIEALVKCRSGVKSGANSGAGEISNEQQMPNEENALAIIGSSQYPCGSSHFTAAVTYHQFMTSNTPVGGVVLPPVPTLVTSNGDSNQTALPPLFYNPYVFQHQHQLQFSNSYRNIPPQPRHIISLPMVSLCPNICLTPSGAVPVLHDNISSLSNLMYLQSGTNTNSALHLTPFSIIASDQFENGSHALKDRSIQDSPLSSLSLCKSSSPGKSVPIHCGEESAVSPVLVDIHSNTDLEEPNNETQALFEDSAKNDNVPSVDGGKSSSNVDIHIVNRTSDNNSDIIRSKDEILSHNSDDENGLDLIENKSLNPELKDRTDLDSISDCNSSRHSEAGDSDDKINDDEIPIHFEEKNDTEVLSVITKNEELDNLADIVKTGFVSLQEDNYEYVTSNLYPETESIETQKACNPLLDIVNTREKSQEISKSIEAKKINVEDDQYNVDMNGMHMLVTSHFLDSSSSKMLNTHIPHLEDNSEHGSPRNFNDGNDISEPQISVCDDVQTDKYVLPQDDICQEEDEVENGNVMWIQNKDDVSTSYDLLARESWEASDGSDVEVDTLPVAEPFNRVEPVIEERIMKMEKKKEKLKCTYKCRSCTEVFTCPKERRVHQSKYHSNKLESESSLKKVDKLLEDSLCNIESREKSETMKELQDLHSIQTELCVMQVAAPQIEEPKSIIGKLDSTNFNDVCLKTSELKKSEGQNSVDPFKHVCLQCNEEYKSSKCLQRHTRMFHKLSSFACRTCEEKFPSEAPYLAHLKIHPLECPQCGKYFYRQQNLNLHMKRHMGLKPYKCTVCDKAFITKQKLGEHNNIHTGEAPIKCDLCSETFRRYSNLVQHKNRHHLKVKKKVKDFVCQCGEVFHSKKKLDWHKEIHDDKPKTCQYCSERFVHVSSLTRHVRKAHDQRYFPCRGRENQNVECPVCACVFLKSSLATHMKIHSGEKRHVCHTCGKKFTTKWNLHLHRWTHASRSTKPFKCSLCNSAFFRHSDYTSHMHSHRNIRPYTCNYCGSQFIRKYNCLRHAKEHEADKSYTCNICQKTFHRSYYLKEHLRTHSGLRPYVCHVCGKASSTKTTHNKHLKIHHAREAVNTEG